MTVISAMCYLIALSVSEESAYNMLEALVLGVRIAKAELRAVNAEDELCASCVTIGTLVDKFAVVPQDSWFRYVVERPHGAECTAIKEWLEI